jgi:hypothetical protein
VGYFAFLFKSANQAASTYRLRTTLDAYDPTGGTQGIAKAPAGLANSDI